MLTEQQILEIFDSPEGEVNVIENPASTETDPTFATIAKRMEQFRRSRHMNPNGVTIDDFDAASVFGDDPKNPSDVPHYSYLFRHRRTGRGLRVQNSARHGFMIPFNVVYELSLLAKK